MYQLLDFCDSYFWNGAHVNWNPRLLVVINKNCPKNSPSVYSYSLHHVKISLCCMMNKATLVPRPMPPIKVKIQVYSTDIHQVDDTVLDHFWYNCSFLEIRVTLRISGCIVWRKLPLEWIRMDSTNLTSLGEMLTFNDDKRPCPTH